jgi:hypothetical protein
MLLKYYNNKIDTVSRFKKQLLEKNDNKVRDLLGYLLWNLPNPVTEKPKNLNWSFYNCNYCNRGVINLNHDKEYNFGLTYKNMLSGFTAMHLHCVMKFLIDPTSTSYFTYTNNKENTYFVVKFEEQNHIYFWEHIKEFLKLIFDKQSLQTIDIYTIHKEIQYGKSYHNESYGYSYIQPKPVEVVIEKTKIYKVI